MNRKVIRFLVRLVIRPGGREERISVLRIRFSLHNLGDLRLQMKTRNIIAGGWEKAPEDSEIFLKNSERGPKKIQGFFSSRNAQHCRFKCRLNQYRCYPAFDSSSNCHQEKNHETGFLCPAKNKQAEIPRMESMRVPVLQQIYFKGIDAEERRGPGKNEREHLQQPVGEVHGRNHLP